MARRQDGKLDPPAVEKRVAPTKRASGRSRTKVAKAASISRLVLALRTWICSPMARAAASTSLNVVSAFAALAGLTSTATRVAAGTSSRRSSSRFAVNSPTEKIDPCQVAARPGEAGDKTKPDRVFGDDEDDGDRRGCRLGRERRSGTSGRDDHGDLSANQFGRQRRQSIDLILGPAVFDRHVLALDIAGVLQALAKCAQTVRDTRQAMWG